MRWAIVIFLFAAVLGYAGWSSVHGLRTEETGRSLLDRAARRARYPARTIVHRGQVLGMLQVPRLGLSVPVVEGSDDESLDRGAGHIPQTAFPGHHGNTGIAAHRDTCFRPLRFIRPGDDILITTPGGVYDYAVSGTEIVMPTDVRVLHRTKSRTLTLVTCYPFFYLGSAPKRFIVHAAQTT